MQQTSTPLNIRFINHITDIRKLRVTKEEQEVKDCIILKHGIGNIKISILKIVLNKIRVINTL